jgi:hypothetical protein
VLLITNGKFVGPFKINQLLKYDYEENSRVKILHNQKSNVNFKMLGLAELRPMVQVKL